MNDPYWTIQIPAGNPRSWPQVSKEWAKSNVGRSFDDVADVIYNCLRMVGQVA